MCLPASSALEVYVNVTFFPPSRATALPVTVFATPSLERVKLEIRPQTWLASAAQAYETPAGTVAEAVGVAVGVATTAALRTT